MFWFKKTISQFLFPFPLCLLICFAGLYLLWFTARQRAGKFLVSAGLLTLTLLSYAPMSELLIKPLEQKYPVYSPQQKSSPKYIVVLGGGYASDQSLPLSSQLSDQSLKRLVEAICIYRQSPGSKIIVSGGKWHDPVPCAVLLREMAIQLGVPDADLLVESESRDTEDEARLIGPMVGTNRFVLVTSANHMPRSMLLFHNAGLEPDPAPAEHLVKRTSWEPSFLFPSGKNLRRTETAFYEWMGKAWLALSSTSSP